MEPTLEQIIEATGGKLSRDEESVIVGFGPLGYYRLTPDYVISCGKEYPAAKIEGKTTRRDGTNHAKVRAALDSAGIRAT